MVVNKCKRLPSVLPGQVLSPVNQYKSNHHHLSVFLFFLFNASIFAGTSSSMTIVLALWQHLKVSNLTSQI